MKLLLVVACALIDRDGRVLIAQRPEGKGMAGLWAVALGKGDGVASWMRSRYTHRRPLVRDALVLGVVEQGQRAVRLAREAGLETWGMFQVGLSADTVDTMKDTVRFAQGLDVDIKRLGITVPFPGTPMFKNLAKMGNIKTLDWDDFNVFNEATQINQESNQEFSDILGGITGIGAAAIGGIGNLDTTSQSLASVDTNPVVIRRLFSAGRLRPPHSQQRQIPSACWPAARAPRSCSADSRPVSRAFIR